MKKDERTNREPKADWSYGNVDVIRKAKLADSKDVFDLRNKDYVKEVSWNPDNIPWEEHVEFWKNNYQFYWIIQSCSDASFIGFVRIKNNEVSIAVLEEYWNQGYGYFALQEIMKHRSDLRAEIKLGNNHSLCFFVKCGFVPEGFVLTNKQDENPVGVV